MVSIKMSPWGVGCEEEQWLEVANCLIRTWGLLLEAFRNCFPVTKLRFKANISLMIS
jgi:hypothetical protein